MDDILVRIKRAILAGRYAFNEKARIEMEADSLTELDVAESIVNAVAITKGKLVREAGEEAYYFLVSSKKVAA